MNARSNRRIAFVSVPLALAVTGVGLLTPAAAANGDAAQWPFAQGAPVSWTGVDPVTGGPSDWSSTPSASDGQITSQASCEAGLYADISLSAITSHAAAGAPAVYANERAGGTVEVIAVTPDGEETLASWTTPTEDRVISTRDDLNAALTGFPATPGQIDSQPGVLHQPFEARESVTAPSIAVFPSEARGTIADTGGSVSWAPGLGAAVGYVQGDPMDPAGVSSGAPSSWSITWQVDLPEDTSESILRLTQLDGTVIDAVSPTDELPAWCSIAAQDHLISVEVGESVDLDLLTGATTAGFQAGLLGVEVETAADIATADALHLTVDGRMASHAPAAEGTYSYAYTARAVGPLGLEASGTVTVIVGDVVIPEIPVDVPPVEVPPVEVPIEVAPDPAPDVAPPVVTPEPTPTSPTEAPAQQAPSEITPPRVVIETGTPAEEETDEAEAAEYLSRIEAALGASLIVNGASLIAWAVGARRRTLAQL